MTASFEDFGNYRILEPLGQGGTAEVFGAIQKSTGQLCALKRLTEASESHPTAPTRFRREAQIASMLAHPAIAMMLDSGQVHGRFYMATELVVGVDVASLIDALFNRKRAVSPPLATAVLQPVLEGLAYAHRVRGQGGEPLNLVHRDLSSKNVMIERTGRIKIIDFGVAYADVDKFKTAPGVIVGSLGCVSPEQALSRPVDHRSDIYSAGVLLYEILTGRPVIQNARTVTQVLQEIVQKIPPPPSARNPMVGPALDRVVAKALEKDPQHRFADADAFKDALDRAVGPSAPVEVLQDLVRSNFPDIFERILRLQREAQDFRMSTHGPPLDDFSALTHSADPDAVDWDDARYFTVTNVRPEETEVVPRTDRRNEGGLQGLDEERTQLERNPTERAEPTRTGPMLPGLDPGMAPQHWQPTTMNPTVLRPAPKMPRIMWALIAFALVLGGGVALLTLQPAPKVSTPTSAPKAARGTTPSVAPRRSAPIPAAASPPSSVAFSPPVDPAPPRRSPRRRPSKSAAPPSPPHSPSADALAVLQRRLDALRAQERAGRSPEYARFTGLLAAIRAQAKRQNNRQAIQRVEEASDCLNTTCAGPPGWLDAIGRALAALKR